MSKISYPAGVQIGDVVFIRCAAPLLHKVADATGCWSNHVGVVIDYAKGDWVVAESRVPFSATTSLQAFIGRSTDRHYALRRPRDLSREERAALRAAALRRMGILYHWGFNLRSRRQFCSKFVREVYAEATGIEMGEIESFRQLLTRNPAINTGFWRVWYFGFIPWNRLTISPSSLMRCPHLRTAFDSQN